MNEEQIVCISNSYLHKYYLGSSFSELPIAIKEELQIAAVLFTERVGGIFTLSFDDNENLYINITFEDDFGHDEIEANLMIERFRNEKKELLTSLERYYNEYVKDFLKREK